VRSPARLGVVAFAALAIDLALAACGQEDTSSVSPFVDEDAARAKNDASATQADDSGEPREDAAASDGADAAKPWPTCNSKPASAATKTIPEIWQANPSKETEVWIEDAYVVAVSGGECVANKACQIFLQTDTSYASLAAASRHAIKVFASAPVAASFNGVAVGDRVDVVGWAWRYDLGGQHELLVQVNALLPGCAKTTSTGHTLTPLSGLSLSDLNVAVYEDVHGPLFVKIADVSGKADASPTATFGLWQTGSFDAGADGGAGIVSLSPFFMPNATFTGLVPDAITQFYSITAVFGLFVPNGGPKYLELHPRTSADLDKQ
jgi:hypothetical protein